VRRHKNNKVPDSKSMSDPSHTTKNGICLLENSYSSCSAIFPLHIKIHSHFRILRCYNQKLPQPAHQENCWENCKRKLRSLPAYDVLVWI